MVTAFSVFTLVCSSLLDYIRWRTFFKLFLIACSVSAPPTALLLDPPPPPPLLPSCACTHTHTRTHRHRHAVKNIKSSSQADTNCFKINPACVVCGFPGKEKKKKGILITSMYDINLFVFWIKGMNQSLTNRSSNELKTTAIIDSSFILKLAKWSDLSCSEGLIATRDLLRWN